MMMMMMNNRHQISYAMDNELMKKLRWAMSRKSVIASPPFQFHPDLGNGGGDSALNYQVLLQELVDTLTQSEHVQFTFANHKKRVETCRIFIALWRYLLRLKDVLPNKEKHLAFQLITCLMKRQEFDPIVHKKYDSLESQSNGTRFFSSLLGRGTSRTSNISNSNGNGSSASAQPAASMETAAQSSLPAQSHKPQLTDVMQEYKLLCEETILEVLLKLRKDGNKLYQEMYAYCAGVLAVCMFRLFDPDRRRHGENDSVQYEPSGELSPETTTDSDDMNMTEGENYMHFPPVEHMDVKNMSEIDRFFVFFKKRMMQFPHLRWIHDNASLSDVEKVMKSSRQCEILDMEIEARTSSFVDEQLLLSPETSNNTSNLIASDDDQHTSKVQWLKQFYGQLFRFNYYLCRRENDIMAPDTTIHDATNAKKGEQHPSPRQQHSEHIQTQLKEHIDDMFSVRDANAFSWIPSFSESSEFFYVFICEYVSQARALLSTHLNLHCSNIPHYRGLMIHYVQSLQNFDPRFHTTAPPSPTASAFQDCNIGSNATENGNTNTETTSQQVHHFYNPLRYLSMYRQHVSDKGAQNLSVKTKKSTLSSAKVFHQKTTQHQRTWSFEAQRKWVSASFVLLKNNPQFINLLLSLFIPSTKTYALNSEVFPLLEYMDLWFREYRNSHIDALQQRFQQQHEVEKIHFQQLRKRSSSTGGRSRLLHLLISPLQTSKDNRNNNNNAKSGGRNISGGGIPMAANRRNNVYETSVYLPAVGFPLHLFLNMVDQLIETNHFQTTVRTLILIYNTIDMFGTKEERTGLIQDCLLKKHFWELFLHWNEDTRACFHRILIYKVKRYTPPPQLIDIQMRLQQTHVLMLKKRQQQKAQAIEFGYSKPKESVPHPTSAGTKSQSRRSSILSGIKRAIPSRSSPSNVTASASVQWDPKIQLNGKVSMTKTHSKSVDSMVSLSRYHSDHEKLNHHDDGYHSDDNSSSQLSDSDTEDEASLTRSRNRLSLPPELMVHASNVIASSIGTSVDSLYGGTEDIHASLAAEEELDIVLKSKVDAFVQVVFITPPTVDIVQERLKKSQLRQVSSVQDEYSSKSHIIEQKQTHSLVAKSEMTTGNLRKREQSTQQDQKQSDEIVHIPHEMTIPHNLRVYIPQAKRAYKNILMEHQQWKSQIDEYFISHAHEVHLCDMLLIDIPFPTITFPQWDIRSDSNM